MANQSPPVDMKKLAELEKVYNPKPKIVEIRETEEAPDSSPEAVAEAAEARKEALEAAREEEAAARVAAARKKEAAEDLGRTMSGGRLFHLRKCSYWASTVVKELLNVPITAARKAEVDAMEKVLTLQKCEKFPKVVTLPSLEDVIGKNAEDLDDEDDMPTPAERVAAQNAAQNAADLEAALLQEFENDEKNDKEEAEVGADDDDDTVTYADEGGVNHTFENLTGEKQPYLEWLHKMKRPGRYTKNRESGKLTRIPSGICHPQLHYFGPEPDGPEEEMSDEERAYALMTAEEKWSGYEFGHYAHEFWLYYVTCYCMILNERQCLNPKCYDDCGRMGKYKTRMSIPLPPAAPLEAVRKADLERPSELHPYRNEYPRNIWQPLVAMDAAMTRNGVRIEPKEGNLRFADTTFALEHWFSDNLGDSPVTTLAFGIDEACALQQDVCVNNPALIRYDDAHWGGDTKAEGLTNALYSAWVTNKSFDNLPRRRHTKRDFNLYKSQIRSEPRHNFYLENPYTTTEEISGIGDIPGNSSDESAVPLNQIVAYQTDKLIDLSRSLPLFDPAGYAYRTVNTLTTLNHTSFSKGEIRQRESLVLKLDKGDNGRPLPKSKRLLELEQLKREYVQSDKDHSRILYILDDDALRTNEHEYKSAYQEFDSANRFQVFSKDLGVVQSWPSDQFESEMSKLTHKIRVLDLYKVLPERYRTISRTAYKMGSCAVPLWEIQQQFWKERNKHPRFVFSAKLRTYILDFKTSNLLEVFSNSLSYWRNKAASKTIETHKSMINSLRSSYDAEMNALQDEDDDAEDAGPNPNQREDRAIERDAELRFVNSRVMKTDAWAQKQLNGHNSEYGRLPVYQPVLSNYFYATYIAKLQLEVQAWQSWVALANVRKVGQTGEVARQSEAHNGVLFHSDPMPHHDDFTAGGAPNPDMRGSFFKVWAWYRNAEYYYMYFMRYRESGDPAYDEAVADEVGEVAPYWTTWNYDRLTDTVKGVVEEGESGIDYMARHVREKAAMEDPSDGSRYCHNTLVYVNPYDQRKNDDGKHADPAENMSGGELELWRDVADASADKQYAAKDALVYFLKGDGYILEERAQAAQAARDALAETKREAERQAVEDARIVRPAQYEVERMDISLVDQLFDGLVIKP